MTRALILLLISACAPPPPDLPDPCCECLVNTRDFFGSDPCIPISVETCEDRGPGTAQCYCWLRCDDYCNVPAACRE